MNRIKVMEWEKVSLVVPEESDAVIWYEWVNNIETQFFLWSMYGEILTVEDEKEYFHMVRKDKTMRLFSLYANETKKVIGNISLINLDFQNRRSSLWIAIFDTTQREKWLGTEAMELMCEYAFDVLGLHKIQLEYIDTNTRAEAVYKKIGFQEVWRMKDHDYRKWKFYDCIMMEYYANDFKNK